MRISDGSSDVCSSDLALDVGVIDFLVKPVRPRELRARCRNLLQLRQQAESVKQRALSLEQRLLSSMHEVEERERETLTRLARAIAYRDSGTSANLERLARRSEEHTSELQSLMRISYAVFCLKKKK